MKHKKIFGGVAAALLVVVVVLLAPALLQLEVKDILNFVPASLPLAALVLVLVYSSKSVLMVIPLAVLYVSAGMLFPVGWAIAVSYIGLACEFSVGFFIGKKIGAKRVHALIEKRPRAGAFLEIMENNDQAACFLARLIPLPMPCDIPSMFFGATGVPYTRYLLFSLLGISAPMIPFVIAGRAVANPLSREFIIPLVVSFTITLGVFFINMAVKKSRKAGR